MKFGIRVPSLHKMIKARLSVKRQVKSRLKLKAPKGLGLLTNPKKAVRNRVYNRTSISAWRLLKKLFKGE